MKNEPSDKTTRRFLFLLVRDDRVMMIEERQEMGKTRQEQWRWRWIAELRAEG